MTDVYIYTYIYTLNTLNYTKKKENINFHNILYLNT